MSLNVPLTVCAIFACLSCERAPVGLTLPTHENCRRTANSLESLLHARETVFLLYLPNKIDIYSDTILFGPV